MNISLGQTIKHLCLILGAVIVILPFYFMVSYSFQSQREIETGTSQDGGHAGFFGSQIPILDKACLQANTPERPEVDGAKAIYPDKSEREIYNILIKQAEKDCSLESVVMNYTQAFTKAPILRYLLNGVIVTVSIFLIQVIVALRISYALA